MLTSSNNARIDRIVQVGPAMSRDSLIKQLLERNTLCEIQADAHEKDGDLSGNDKPQQPAAPVHSAD